MVNESNPFKDYTNQLAEILQEKNHAYGDSFTKSVDEDGKKMNYEAETQWENDNQDVYIWLINDLSTGEKWLFWYSHKPGETAPFHAGSKFDEDHFELLKKYCYKYRRFTSVEEDIPNDCFVSLSFSWWNK